MSRLKIEKELDMRAHAWNPRAWHLEARRKEDCEFEVYLGYVARLSQKKKIEKEKHTTFSAVISHSVRNHRLAKL
jgi:hypothetical protein